MASGKFGILSMWWSDTDQHRWSLAAYLRDRTNNGLSLQDLCDDLERRTDGRFTIHRSTMHRWVEQLQKGDTPA